jgi:uncharacterized protein
MPEKPPAPLFSFPVADLEHGDREIEAEIPIEWLRTAFVGTEALPRDRPGRLEVTLSKSGKDVMIRGRAEAYVVMPCARTLDPVDVDLNTEIFLLLSPGPVSPHRPARVRKTSEKAAPRPAPAKPADAKRKKKEEEKVLSEEEAAEDTYDGETVVLDPFLTEFLVLELPMFPLREDLRSGATPAIERDPEPAETGPAEREVLDPRLAPLAAIASRLRQKKE